MTFNSFKFLVFFTVVTTLYFVSPQRLRWLLLLVASCVFYMAFVPLYIFILFFTIIIDYFAGVFIEKAVGTKRLVFLILSLISNLGVLSVFKYSNFAIGNAAYLGQLLDLHLPIKVLEILLPIGLSFHTFQAMSYTIEVYRKKQAAERHFGIFALYVMFYPQLVAGPIERPQNLLHQFYEHHGFDSSRFVDGLTRMLWGLFKKVVIADRMAFIVNTVYAAPASFSSLQSIYATVCFGIQIYADFSAYTDIALGAASVMGFRLMENFDRPYLSTSPVHFWRRWHISLTTWFRDYLYIPMGGNRVTQHRRFFNIMVVFLLSGLWHGANWTYIVWGALHGMYLIADLATGSLRQRVSHLLHLEHVSTLCNWAAVCFNFALVSFAWIYFRSDNLAQANYIVQRLGTDSIGLLANSGQSLYDLKVMNIPPLGEGYIRISNYIIIMAAAIHIWRRPGSIVRSIEDKPIWLRWIVYYAMILGILLFGTFGSQSFIYFQF